MLELFVGGAGSVVKWHAVVPRISDLHGNVCSRQKHFFFYQLLVNFLMLHLTTDLQYFVSDSMITVISGPQFNYISLSFVVFFFLFTLTQIVKLPQSRAKPPAVTGRRVKTAHKDDCPLFDSILCQCFPSWVVCVDILESSTAVNKLPTELPFRENLNGVCSNRLDRQEGLLTLKIRASISSTTVRG